MYAVPFPDADLRSILEDVLSSLSDGVIVIDSGGHQIFVNEAGSRLFQPERSAGQAMEERVSGLQFRYLDGRRVAPARTPAGRALRGETVTDIGVVIRRADGSSVEVNLFADPIRDASGNILGIGLVFREVDRQPEARLKPAKAKAGYYIVSDGMLNEGL